jgi:hypothetical protein
MCCQVKSVSKQLYHIHQENCQFSSMSKYTVFHIQFTDLKITVVIILYEPAVYFTKYALQTISVTTNEGTVS